MNILVQITENDRRAIIIILVIFLILLLLVGLLGMLIRFINKKFAYRMDVEIHDAIRYGAITDKKVLMKYGNIKNWRVYFLEMLPAMGILAFGLVFWIVVSLVTGAWDTNHFERFSTVFFIFDWSNPENYANFFGITLLCRFPELLSSPHLVADYWASYIIAPVMIIGLVYYFVVSQAFVCRYFQLRKRCRTVFNKSLDGYNYYDHANLPKSVPNTQMGPHSDPNNPQH